MEKYSSYKDSGVQWLGEIPSHWNLSRLKQFVSIKKGIKPNLLTFDQIDYPYLSMNYLRSREGKEIEYPTNNKGLFFVNEDKTIVLWDGANAGEFIKSKKGYLGSTMAILQPNRQIYQEQYFFYLMKSIEPTSKDYANGTTIPHFNPSIILDYNYPIPPIYEQQSMASYLDKATAEIDKAIAQQQHMIDLLNERKQIIIQRAVTKGLDEKVEMKDSGVEWIGDIPAHWQVKKLKYIANTNSGSTPRNISGKGSPSSNIKWVRTTDLNNDIVTDTSEYLSKQEMASASCPLLEPNTVLISMYGGSRSFGKIGILGIEATINQALCSISANDDILPKYLFYYLQSVNKIWMKFAASSRKDPNLNQEIIRNIHIAYPQSKDEQDMVVGMLEKSIREVNNGISQYESLISTLQERKQIIISEVVTGKIKVS